MKFLVPNYSCLQNHWLGGLPPPDLHSLCPQLNLLNPLPRTKVLGTPLLCCMQLGRGGVRQNTTVCVSYLLCWRRHVSAKGHLQVPFRHSRRSTVVYTTCDTATIHIPKCPQSKITRVLWSGHHRYQQWVHNTYLYKPITTHTYQQFSYILIPTCGRNPSKPPPQVDILRKTSPHTSETQIRTDYFTNGFFDILLTMHLNIFILILTILMH